MKLITNEFFKVKDSRIVTFGLLVLRIWLLWLIYRYCLLFFILPFNTPGNQLENIETNELMLAWEGSSMKYLWSSVLDFGPYPSPLPSSLRTCMRLGYHLFSYTMRTWSILANPIPTPTPPLHTHTHDPFSKKCNIWCYKGYTDKNEKQVGCYVNLDGVKTCPDALDHWYTLSNLFVILIMYLFFLHFVLQMRFYMVTKSIHLFLFQNFRYQTLYNKN